MAEHKLDDLERERARVHAESAEYHLGIIAELMAGKLGPDIFPAGFAESGSIRLKRPAARAGAEYVYTPEHPMVLEFQDDNGNCIGLYVDPPGICTDEC